MKNDKLRLDSHKLMYHPERVADWMKGARICPIYVEIGPAGPCNCRCVFCSVEYIGYKKRFLDTEMLKERLDEMGRLGVKSIMYAGEGEPFLHKDITEIIVHTNKAGIDSAITTNGILMKPVVSEKIIGVTEWIKVSCNAGTAETYEKIHRTKASDFDKVIANLSHAVQVKRKNNYSCTLGVQILLLHENAKEVITLAKIAQDIGLDYIVVKPYTYYGANEYKYKINYEQYGEIAERLQNFNTESFKAIFRAQTMQTWDLGHREYEACNALPFWAHIDAGGNVWGCGAHLEDQQFLYGNVNQDSFESIWQGEKRLAALQRMEEHFDISQCRLNCRMDKINKYLWELKNKVQHVNFI